MGQCSGMSHEEVTLPLRNDIEAARFILSRVRVATETCDPDQTWEERLEEASVELERKLGRPPTGQEVAFVTHIITGEEQRAWEERLRMPPEQDETERADPPSGYSS